MRAIFAFVCSHPLGPNEVGVEALAWIRAPEASDTEARLAELARSGATVPRVLTALAGRLVAERVWDRLGYVRLRDYASERLGLSARQVQDLAHVDRELRRLPQIDAAFVAGRLTWTKVRVPRGDGRG